MASAAVAYSRPDQLSSICDRAAGAFVRDGLRELAQREDALGRGTRALLHCWKAAHAGAVQVLSDGRWYVESCPAYLTTVSGMTRWAASVAWKAARSLVGWTEATVSEVVGLGARLRQLPNGKRRGGRHLLLDPWQALAVLDAAGCHQRLQGAACAGVVVLPLPAAVKRLQEARGARTTAICCPAHQDASPSLVLWHNGGAQCMTCGWRAAWEARGHQLLLRASRGHRSPAYDAHQHAASTTKTPPVDREGPVGGMVATRSRAARYVGAVLEAWRDGDRWRQTRSAGQFLTGDVPQVLLQAERRSAGPAATEHALAAAVCGAGLPARAVLPDRLLAVSCMGRRSWREPWEARVQRWMLLDLDDVQQLPHSCTRLGEQLVALAVQDPEVCEAVAVRTSPTGVQVWVKLEKPRHSPVTWCRLPSVRRWHADLGQRLLHAAHEAGASGGLADPSACAAGRFGRRPGWRLVNGRAYRSHLLAVRLGARAATTVVSSGQR